MSIDCKFECQFEEIKSYIEVKIDHLPCKNENEEWLTITTDFEDNDDHGMHKILNKFYKYGGKFEFGEGKISVEGVDWLLTDLYPEAINFSDLDFSGSSPIIIIVSWRFSDAKEIKTLRRDKCQG